MSPPPPANAPVQRPLLRLDPPIHFAVEHRQCPRMAKALGVGGILRNDPARLGAGGIQHAGAQNAQLELADAALHAKQQPVIGPAGIVDAIDIYDTGFNKTTQFQQVMPMTAIAGEPRGIEAQDSANFASTQPGNQPIKAQLGDGPAC